MRVGLFGPEQDVQVRALAAELDALGAEPVLINDDALTREVPTSSLDGHFRQRGVDWDTLSALYLRRLDAPFLTPLAPASFDSYEAWFIHSMQVRERASFLLAWLLSLEARGVRLINPPTAMSELMFPPAQEAALRRVGAPVVRAVVSNDAVQVRALAGAGPLECRPLLDDGPWEPLHEDGLDSTVPLQVRERLMGPARLVLAGEVAVVAPPERGPLPEEVVQQARAAARACGLTVVAFTVARREDAWVFLELDAAPAWAELEPAAAKSLARALARELVRAP